MMLDPRQQLLLPSAEQYLVELTQSLEGSDKARCLAIASITMVIYEYFLTIDDEVSLHFLYNGFRNSVLTLPQRFNISGRENGPYHVYYIY
jgi:hypothetical protein